MESDKEARIRERAYFLWKKEGCPEGQDVTFWERARLLQEAEGREPVSTPLTAISAARPALSLPNCSSARDRL